VSVRHARVLAALWLDRAASDIARAVALRLPRRVAYFAAGRVWAEATTRTPGRPDAVETPGTVTMAHCLRRWGTPP